MEENIFTAGVAGVRSLTEIFSTAGYMQVMHLAPRCKPPVVRTHGRKLQIPWLQLRQHPHGKGLRKVVLQATLALGRGAKSC